MPKKKRNKKQMECKASYPSLAELSLDDYANSINGTSRVKKADKQPIMKEITYDEEVFDLPWFEEDMTKVKKIKKKPIVYKCPTSEESCIEGCHYPIDFWFILSEYIQPEDVLRFSLICKTALEVVCSPSFWSSLYKRFYVTNTRLPERLQHHSMDRLFGLRPAVIRYLYYTFPPYMEVVNKRGRVKAEFQNLIGLKCISMWFKKLNQRCYFFFKFLEKNSKFSLGGENYSVINYNPEEGCKILQICCKNYISQQSVMGYHIQEVLTQLSTSMCHEVIRLHFTTNYFKRNKHLSSDGSVVLVFDSVIHYKISDWWLPDYPAYEESLPYNNIDSCNERW